MRGKLVSILLYASLWVISLPVSGKDIKYVVADIPKALKENARSVVRNEEIVLSVKSISKASVNVTYAVTILNKNGLKDAYFHEFYDKFSKISGIKGRVFDENGEQIKKILNDEILDYSAISGYSIYEDDRVKYIDPKFRNFPFTVEYSYEQSWDGLFMYPTWEPQSDFNVSVERSSYKITIPKTMTLKYLEHNIPSHVSVAEDAENNIYNWEMHNVNALEEEPWSVPNQDIFPSLFAVPAEFEIDGFKGNLNSWENFGKFISVLNKGKNVLNDETKKMLNGMVQGTSDQYEKIRKIYEYMQNRTRYVSIQIGIGGFQPFDAATVHRLSYGDCKALANYMKTMLEAVGIKSYYCLVNAGSSAPFMIKEFPSSQFNHAFLCVPMSNDTIWLECTSQRVPCGFLGDFTDDRDVFLIDNEKSKVVHSKIYGIEDNMEIRKSLLKIDETGNGSAEIHNIYKGLKYDDILPAFLADDADKKKIISERLKFPGFHLLNYKYKENRTVIPSIEEILDVTIENCLTQMGSRYILRLNPLDNLPIYLHSRKTDIIVRRPSLEADTIVYELPLGLKPEILPLPVSFDDRFGSFRAKVDYVGNRLSYIRIYKLYKGRYPASDYTDFTTFFDKITNADAIKCILVKN